MLRSHSSCAVPLILSWLLLLLLVVMVVQQVVAAETFYIDPSRDTNGDGTESNPFNTWDVYNPNYNPRGTRCCPQRWWKCFDNIQLCYGNTYLQKRGTIANVSLPIVFEGSVTVGAYGEGARPIIRSISTNTNDKLIGGWHAGGVVIRDFEFYSLHRIYTIMLINEGLGNSSQYFSLIDNCVMHGAKWGFRMYGNNYGHVLNHTEIYDTLDDGVWIQDSENITISYCHIHDVNQEWFNNKDDKVSGGDGIQFFKSRDWWVHHNIIDHSTTGNKQAFFSSGDYDHYSGCGRLEYNMIIGPKGSFYPAQCLSDYEAGDECIIRYNTFVGAGVPTPWEHWGIAAFQTKNNHAQIYGNVFANTDYGVVAEGYNSHSYMTNNVFYNISHTIVVGSQSMALTNNAFVWTPLNPSTSFVEIKQTLVAEDHNMFNIAPSAAQICLFQNPNDCHISELSSDSLVNVTEPLFVNPAQLDFHLQAGSPLIDEGSNVYPEMVGMTADRDGDTMHGVEWDIGIDEYVPPENVNPTTANGPRV